MCSHIDTRISSGYRDVCGDEDTPMRPPQGRVPARGLAAQHIALAGCSGCSSTLVDISSSTALAGSCHPHHDHRPCRHPAIVLLSVQHVCCGASSSTLTSAAAALAGSCHPHHDNRSCRHPCHIAAPSPARRLSNVVAAAAHSPTCQQQRHLQ